MRMFKWATVFLAVWMLAACSTTTQQKVVSVGKPKKIEPLPSSYSEFSSKQIEEDAREFARILSQDHLGKYYTPLAQNKIKLVVKRNPEDNLKVYQERFTRSFQGALNKWVREFLPPEKYGEFFLALNDDLSDRKFNNLNDVQEIEEDPVTKLKYVGFIILEFLNGKTGDGTTKEFEASFIPLDYERTRSPPMNFSKLWIPEHLRPDVRCRKGSFCDPFVVEKDNPSNIGLYYTDTFCSNFHFPNPTKGYILNFKGIQPNTAKIFQLLLENKLECMDIVVNDSTLKDVYKWEEAADRLGFFRDENSSPKATKPTVLFEGTGVSMGSKTYFTIRMIYWNQEKAGQVARDTSQDIYLIENNSQKLAASSIQDKISKIESVLQRNLNEGTEAENRADVINALSHYLSGYQKAPSLPPLKSALHVITGSRESSRSQNISAGGFESKIKGIVLNLNLATVSGDQQIVKTQKGVALPLVAKVYLLKEGNQIPVSNIPVVFSYETGQGELEKEKTSGPDGTVQTTIHKISSYEEANHVIAVKLDYSRIRSSFDGDFAEKLLSPLKKKKATFNYAVQTPKWASNKSQAWRESITDLSNQLIKNIPPERNPLLGVIPFKDLRYDRITPFSRILNEDIKTILARAEDLKLKEMKINKDQQPEEIAKANGLDYYVSGSYRMERTGLEVRARLIDTETSNIHGTGTVLIERKELNPEDLEFLDNMAEEFKSAQKKKSYQEQLEKLVAAKPYKSPLNVKVWTDKKKYQIGEKITFSVKAEENCYLTLLDINPQGGITVIYPNRFHRDNFIQAGVTYKVPRERDNFALDVRGPAGQERIKAIVTLNKVSLLKLDLNKGFHSVQGGTTRGSRDIQAISKKIISFDDSEWAEAYTKIVIFEKGKPYTLGSRKIPILE